MPFNPDEFLAKKQAATGGPATNPQAGFNPDAFLQSKGIQTLPNQGNIQDGPSAAEAMARGAAQGATMGFGDELSAGLGALAPTETDNALNRSYSDRYANIRDTIRGQNAAAANAHPVVSALSEIAGSIPATVATGAGLASLGRGMVRNAATQGAIYGLGKSSGTADNQLEDSAKSGLLAAGLAKGFQMLSSPASKPLAEITKKAGDYEIKYGAGLKDSFKLGQDMQDVVSNPEVQQSISRELNDQQANIGKVIQTTKQSLGTKAATLMDQHGDAPADLKDVFSTIYKKVNNIAPEGDEIALKAQQALSARIKGIEDQLLASSKSGSLSDVPLKALAEAQQALGGIVFEQGAYRKVPAVNGAAKLLYGKLADAFSKADIEVGSGGDLANINKAFSALYKMQENKLTGATIKSLASDPQNTAALKAYDSFVKPFANLEAGVRAALAPELDSYISNTFQKSLLKAQIMKTITGRGPSTTNEGIIGWALKKAYLGPGTLDNMANKLGSLSGNLQANPQVAGSLNALSSGLSAVAPAAGALTTVK